MALQIPSHPNPYGPPLVDAYGWCGAMTLNFEAEAEHYTLLVHPDAASAAEGKPAQVRKTYIAGAGGFPTLAQMLAEDPTLAQCFGYIRAKFYATAAQVDPDLAGSTDVP